MGWKKKSKKGLKSFGTLRDSVMGPYRNIQSKWEKTLLIFPEWIRPWIRDGADVLVTVSTIIIFLKLTLGADMLVPLVVVTSSSMEHASSDMSWKTWMNTRGLDDNLVYSFPMTNGFDMGDMIVVSSPKSSLGDIVIYERDLDHLKFASKDPIIHRVVGEAYVKDYEIVGYNGTLDCYSMEKLRPFVDLVKACQTGSRRCPYTKYPSGGDFRLYITKGDNNVGSDQCNPQIDISYPVNDAQVTGKAFLRLPYLGYPKLVMSLIWRLITFQF